jgi:tetratricopeptide (TPR) repeat protein
MPQWRRALVAALLATGLAGWRIAAAEETPAPSGGVPTGQHSAADERDLDAQLQAAVEFIYRSRLPEARRISEDVRRRFPEDPRVYLLEARILRETYPDQSTEDQVLIGLAAPIHAGLQRAIQLCDGLIEKNPRDGAAWGYRGWARLFAAQMYSLADQYWSAGREAKHGKTDLDRALELDPNNSDAKGILGTYLYFADVLPRVVKVARTILRVPGGDRARGLRLLHDSAAGTGYNRLDARALIGAIQFAFEGDYDAGIAVFESLLRDFPDNPRMMEPIAALDLVRPRGPTDIERVAAVAQQYAGDTADWYRQLSHRLTFYQALSEIVQGDIDAARQHLDTVRLSRPTQPDWFPGDVALCLAEAHLLVGDGPAAAALARGSTSKTADRLRFAAEPGEAATPDAARIFREAQQAARALYGGELDAARQALQAVANADDPGVHFYRGELARFDNDSGLASQEFRSLTDRDIPRRWRLYKVLAFSRLAELEAQGGDARRASATLARAMEFDEDRDLLRHLIRARRRYFELLSEGKVLPQLPLPPASTPTTDGASR